MNDPKVRVLYEDFYRSFGVDAAWTPPARMRVFRDNWPTGGNKPKPGMSPEAKAKLARIVSRAPEVMVKVSGRTRDGGHLREHMNYITRNGKVEAETDYGVMKGKAAIDDLHADWADDEVIYRGQHQVRKAPLSVNMVLSMPPGVDREAFRNAVRDFVDAEIRPRADVMVAFHDDTMHPHAHVTVRGRQHDGRTFNPGKPVLEKYREQFASALRNRGIEAEATPRYARGRTLKADRQHIRHMRARGLMPRVDRSAIDEAFKERPRSPGGASGAARRAGQGTRSRPWETAAESRHMGVRAVYSAAAKELANSTAMTDRQLALKVEEFVKAMPMPTFRQDLYRQALDRQIAERQRKPEQEKKRDGPER